MFLQIKVTDTKVCKTIGGGSPNTKCVFPFKIKGKIYNACTDYSSTDGAFWCSTKVDSNGNHISGQKLWGVCGPNCSLEGN